MELLQGYSWPGNVRELRNQMRRATLLCTSMTGVITPELFMALDAMQPKTASCERADSQSLLGEISVLTDTAMLFSEAGASLKEITARVTAQVERLVLLQTLKHANGNKALAARMLKIDYKTIHSKLKMYEISSNLFAKNNSTSSSYPAIENIGEANAG